MKQLNTLICFIILNILAFGNFCFGQHLNGTLPASFGTSQMFSNFGEMRVDPADADFIAQAISNDEKEGLYVIAQLKDVDITPLNSGTWEELDNGATVWRARITSRDARGLSLYFDRFNLPEGGELYVYDETRSQLIGGYTSEDNTGDNGFVIGIILGQSVIIEYVAPGMLTPGAKKAVLHSEVEVPDLSISQVGYVFRGLDQLECLRDIGDSESCEVNVNCPEGQNWQLHKQAVVRIFVREGNSAGWCSGTLINNLASDGTPYVLTANHCGPDATAANFNQWRFDFNLEYTTCTGSTQAQMHSRTGCTKKAYGPMSGGSDFYLLQLNQAPDNSWNPIYAGWRRDNTAATTVTGIHHPAGDVKKISSSTTVTTGSYTGCASNAHWVITDWRQTQTNLGVTEGGSSGSGLFDQDGYLVGTLTGGSASCSYPHHDLYGKLYYHWDRNGSSNDMQAKPWLDPNNTGNTTCPMFDPNNPDNPNPGGGDDDDDDDDPDTPGEDPDNPGTPDEPDTPGVEGNCHKLHYPLGGTLTIYRTPDEGYLAGTNSYGDLAKADYFQKDSTEEYIVNMIMNVGMVSGTGNITFCVWADNNGQPGAILGSKTVSLSEIVNRSYIENDPQMPTNYPQLRRRYYCKFNTAITVNGSFFAGFMVPTSGTFGLVTNSQGNAANTAWEMNSDSTWSQYSDADSWGISLTHALFPQLCDDPAATEIEDVEDINTVIYPNPTSGNVTVRLENSEIETAEIKVYDLNGKLLQVEQQKGSNEVTLNLSPLTSGMYIISVQTGNQNFTKKISLIK